MRWDWGVGVQKGNTPIILYGSHSIVALQAASFIIA